MSLDRKLILMTFFASLAALATTGVKAGDSCLFSENAIAMLEKGVSYEAVAKQMGCPGKKISSFEMLGSTTEMFWFDEGERRLQVTFRNGHVSGLRRMGFEPTATGSIR